MFIANILSFRRLYCQGRRAGSSRFGRSLFLHMKIHGELISIISSLSHRIHFLLSAIPKTRKRHRAITPPHLDSSTSPQQLNSAIFNNHQSLTSVNNTATRLNSYTIFESIDSFEEPGTALGKCCETRVAIFLSREARLTWRRARSSVLHLD